GVEQLIPARRIGIEIEAPELKTNRAAQRQRRWARRLQRERARGVPQAGAQRAGALRAGLGHAARALALQPSSPAALALRGSIRFQLWRLNLDADPARRDQLLDS